MRREVTPVFVSLVFFAAAYSARAGSFEIIGSGEGFEPSALSADGSTLVGSGQDASGNTEAMLWTQTGGLSFLGTPAEYPSNATAVSGNGAVIVGLNENTSTNVDTAWEWTTGGGYQNINVPGFTNVFPTSITPDASKIGLVGIFTPPNGSYPRSLVDNVGSGFTEIQETYTEQAPNGIILSADGKLAFGATQQNFDGYISSTDGAGPASDIPLVPGTTSHNVPEAITADDSTIFGEAENSGSPGVVFKYGLTTGITTAIGTPDPSGIPSPLVPFPLPLAMGATANGNMLVGTEQIENPSNASKTETYPWVWTSGGGFESLLNFLVANGINTGDYNIYTLDGISPDGSILYGSGFSIGPEDQSIDSGWIVYLPEPNTALVLLPLALALRRRRKGDHVLQKKRWI